MARNAEKAILLLNRWQSMKHSIHQGANTVVPKNPKLTDNLSDAERYRRMAHEELVSGLINLEDATASEISLRSTNEHVTKLVVQLKSWDNRVIDLGGTPLEEHKLLKQFIVTKDGTKWYGACRFIPSIRKHMIFDNESTETAVATNRQPLNAYYFGLRE